MPQTHSTSPETIPSQARIKNQLFLKEFKLSSFGVGLFSLFFLIPFSIQLPFTWVQGLFWGMTGLPILLAFYPSSKSEKLTTSLKGLFLCTFLLQLGLLLLLVLGFFWDATQTPEHLHSHSVLTLQPINDKSSHYFVETDTDYQVFVQGELGIRIFSYPKSKVSIVYQEGLLTPTLETLKGCSHHWVETLINHLFDLDEHLSLQTRYQLTLPTSFQGIDSEDL